MAKNRRINARSIETVSIENDATKQMGEAINETFPLCFYIHVLTNESLETCQMPMRKPDSQANGSQSPNCAHFSLKMKPPKGKCKANSLDRNFSNAKNSSLKFGFKYQSKRTFSRSIQTPNEINQNAFIIFK